MVKELVALELIFDDGTRKKMSIEEFAKLSKLVELTEEEERKLKEAAEILIRALKQPIAKLFKELMDIVKREGAKA